MFNIMKPVAAGAVVLASLSATPAAADNEALGRVILGVAGIAALAAIIDKQQSRKKVVNRSVPVAPKQRHVAAPRIDYQQCLRQRWTQSGWQTFVSNTCVNRLQRQANTGHNERVFRKHGNRPRLARR